jgi:hypothetical protein
MLETEHKKKKHLTKCGGAPGTSSGPGSGSGSGPDSQDPYIYML